LANEDKQFDPADVLTRLGQGRTIVRYRKDKTVYEQGDSADAVFYVRKGRIKICKLIPYTSLDSLGGKTFDFAWRVDGRSGTEHLKPGECTYVLGESNVIDANGNPTPVTVTETTPGLGQAGGYSIDSINVQFGRPDIITNTTTGVATWNLGPDTNVVTYTNRSIDP